MVASLILFACESTNPPKSIQDAFTKKFTSAEKVKWEQEEENEWEAEFMMNGKEMSACFDNSGSWIETEASLSIDELPSLVVDSLHLKFEGFEIKEAVSLENMEFNGFEIIIASGEEEMEITITADGVITGKKMAEEDEGEEGDEKDDD